MKPSLPARRLPGLSRLSAACGLLLVVLAPGAPAADASAAHGAQLSYPVPSYKMKSGWMVCGSRERIDVQAEGPDDRAIRLTWKGRHYLLQRKPTTTGAYHFDDRKAGLVMIQIPAKSMLFDNKHMLRLADNCNPVPAGTFLARK